MQKSPIISGKGDQMKYIEKKKYAPVEAFEWNSGTEYPLWVLDAIDNGSVDFIKAGTADVQMIIDVPNSTLIFRAKQGDFIVKEDNEIRCYSPQVFNNIFEKLKI